MLETLKKIGLEETEANVYLALLKMGPSGASEIARQAGVSRTLCYHGLEKLGWMGLVDRSNPRGKITKFTASSPKYLVQYVKDKERVWKMREQQVRDKLPGLLDLYKIADKPSVRFQEGVEGMKSIYWETLESKETILGILNPKAWYSEELGIYKWGREYVRERGKRKIFERILLFDTPESRDWVKGKYMGADKFTEYRWIKPEDIPAQIKEFSGEINAYENKVMMSLFNVKSNLPSGIMIESEALASIIKVLHNMAWKHATLVVGKKRVAKKRK